ncbi:chromosome segregation protein SMC [Carnobacterium inhibens]|uniref:Chromosome partition protein Smc n=1 Tax=Carnobacterium inhibens subsp. gilichinskyi TaxID=1266845 RepID=U5S8F1_9LACT|nr:chromosome segregation protein SMC [Carnobacterium inhibens]AGY81544.1 chromosome partitioning protein SMC [Carnobacterium inhibens subsp. gilichinskyi]
MQLKRIDITGFKSFADKTTIEFHDGVTAVVGPNGSGKSNITEAIRWVLGEQSAKNLRGGRMNDIIFSGSDTRKPVNVAEVTLILENEDHFLPLEFSEISITRRLNRNGDSEFYLNKQACRLKDIVDLFMDSGLGKESFSIISQGKVESIFNSKPEERRAIFEEAAGVLKYKTRKKKAEQKLTETEENLNRVQDIVYELEDQVEPLREQSSIAKEYLLYKEQLTEMDIALTVVEIERLKLKWDESKTGISSFDNQLIEKKQQLAECEDQLKIKRKQKAGLTETIEEVQEQLVQAIQLFEQTEGQKNVLSERNKYTTENLQQLETSKEQLNQKIVQLEQQLNTINEFLATKNQKENQVKAELSAVEKEILSLSGNSKETIEILRDEYVDLMQKQTSLRNEQSYLERSSYQMAQRNLKSNASVIDLEKNIKDITEKIELISHELKDAQQEIAQKLLQYQETQAHIQSKRQELEANETRMYDALKVVQQAKAKKESLKELNEDYAGFYQGVREILKQKQQVGGIIGAVAELIEVPKQAELAIDSALGAASQNIIVQDEQSGRKGIQYLKQKRLGRATFLPLTTIKARHLPSVIEQKARNCEGYLGIASQLVTYPTTVAHIIQNLLGTTIVAQDLASANRIAREIQFKYRVVTLEGDVMNAGGSMTGGASKSGNQGSLFGRKNELTNLTKQITQMEETLTKKEIEVRTLKQDIKKEEISLNELREHGERQRLREQELKNQAETLEEKQVRLTRELKVVQYENHEAKEEAESYELKKVELAEALQNVTTEMEQINRQILLASSQNEEREKNQTVVNEKQQSLRTELVALKEQLVGLKKEQKAVSSQLESQRLEVKAMDSRMEQMTQFDGSHQMTRKELDDKLAQLTETKHKLDIQLSTLKEEKNDIELQLNDIEQLTTLTNNQKHYLLEEKTKFEVALNRTDVAIENRLNYLTEEYELTFEAAKESHILEISVEEATRTVKLLKQSIEELGSVNIGAIEEFERVNERYSFLVDQREDLLEAKISLYTTMNEMDEEVKLRFSEVFEDIRTKFSVVFPQMFGGGSAELRLTDPENLLTTGIDIIAQPPGKKLQQLSLLSGGERAFTAIALMFSIIQVRPVPFCILDEVEAALDEANVIRFGRYLKQFDGDTQFIVITHRKGTMEEANVLYGITMQESGISKVVSVRLEEINDVHASIT